MSRRHITQLICAAAFAASCAPPASTAPPANPTSLPAEFLNQVETDFPIRGATQHPSNTPPADTFLALPEGDYVVYLRRPRQEADLHELVIISMDGRISETLQETNDTNGSISPDKVSIALTNPKATYVRLLRLGTNQDHLVGWYRSPTGTDWSPDGSSLLVSSETGLSIVDTTSGIQDLMLDCQGLGISCTDAGLSADGHWLAFNVSAQAAMSSNITSGLYVAPASCLDAHDKCITAAVGRLPAMSPHDWSPTGHTLAYCANSDNEPALFLLSPAYWTSQSIGPCPGTDTLIWAPDGASLAASTHGSLWLVDALTGETVQIINDQLLDRALFWISLPLP